MLDLVRMDYQDQVVSFTEDGWFNATQAAERFGKRVDNYLANAETKEYIEALCDGDNPWKVRDFVKTKRGRNGGTWFHPELAVHFARWLDVRFAVWCDRQIRKLLSGNHPHYDWKKIRHEASSSFKVMNQVLLMARQRLGKTSSPHHFSNEARLINYALTGEFGKVDRDGLSKGDLDLLAKLESLNTVLIGCGVMYSERKAELERFTEEQRVRLIETASAQPLVEIKAVTHG